MRSLSGILQRALGRAWKNLIPGLAGSRILLRGMEASRTPSLGAFPAPKAKEFLWMAFVALVFFLSVPFLSSTLFPVFFFLNSSSPHSSLILVSQFRKLRLLPLPFLGKPSLMHGWNPAISLPLTVQKSFQTDSQVFCSQSGAIPDPAVGIF